MPTPVTRAVIPAAGLGTRMLPATRSVPKEMLTVVDRPAIQYVVAEAVAAGLDQIVLVTRPSRSTVIEHFQPGVDVNAAPTPHDALDELRAITDQARFEVVHQASALGLGHAVGRAREHVGEHPFVVLLPDKLMANGATTVRALLDVHLETGTSVVALHEVPLAEIGRYGCPAVSTSSGSAVRVTDFVEKPAPGEAPSGLAAMGRYLFGPEIFDHLDQLDPGVGGEIQLSDAMARLARAGQLHGVVLDEPSHDTGHHIGYLGATVELALDHDELGDDFGRALIDIMRRRRLVD